MANGRNFEFSIIDKASKLGVSYSEVTVKWKKGACVDITCFLNEDKTKMDVFVSDECENTCIEGQITCRDKDGCETLVLPIKKCFCNSNADCGACEDCGDNGLCESRCEKGEECNDVDQCIEGGPCKNGRVKTPNGCECPPGLYEFENDCRDCRGDQDCPTGWKCTREGCKPPNEVCDQGFWDVDKDKCVECLKNVDCPPGAECDDEGNCVCKRGYIPNPNGVGYIQGPNCYKDNDCPECFECDGDDCVPQSCPEGKACWKGDCYDICDCEGTGCGANKGCLNIGPVCICVPCELLDCDTECGLAKGCACTDGEICQGDGCPDIGSVALGLRTIQGTPGTPNNDGCDALTGSGTVTPEGNLFSSPSNNTSLIQDHRFNLTVGSGGCAITDGKWFYSPQSGTKIPLSGTSTSAGGSISFSLRDVQFNSFGFYVIFEAGDGRSITYKVLFTQPGNGTALQEKGNWKVEVQRANSIGGSTSGGTPTVTKVCVIGGTWNFARNGATGGLTIIPKSGNDLDVNFSVDPSDPSCLIYTTAGCGIWDGQIEIACGNKTSLVDVPTIEIDQSRCCDEGDEDCFGTGKGCDDDGETIDISDYIELYPLFGADNEHSVQIKVSENDPSSPISFNDLWRLGDKLTDCFTQDNEFMPGGVFDSSHEENSDIFKEAILNTDLGGQTLTTICFGEECSDGLLACKKVSGCTEVDICEDAAVILLDKQKGEIINGKTFSDVSAGDEIDVLAIFSLPNQSTPLSYTWSGVDGVGLQWVSGPTVTNIGDAQVSEGRIRVVEPGNYTVNLKVDNGLCEAEAFIYYDFQCTETLNVQITETKECGFVSALTATGASTYIWKKVGSTVQLSGSTISSINGGEQWILEATGQCETTRLTHLVSSSNLRFEGSTTVCPGDSFTIPVTGGTPGSVIVTNQGTITLDSNGSGSLTLNNLNATTVVMISTIDGQSCGSASYTINVQSGGTISITTANQDNFCEGEDISFTLAGTAGVYGVELCANGSNVPIRTEQYTHGGGTSVYSGFSNLPKGNYVLKISDSDSVCETTSSGEMTFTVSGDNLISNVVEVKCEFNPSTNTTTFEYNVIHSGGTLTTSGISVNTTPIAGGTTVSGSYTGNQPQNIILNLSATGNCGGDLQALRIECGCDDVAAPTVSNQTVCNGASFSPIQFTVPSGYRLLVNGGPVSTPYTPTAGTKTFQFVNISNPNSCPSPSVSAVFTESAGLNVTQTGTTTVCSGEAATVNVSVLGGSGGYTYEWDAIGSTSLNGQQTAGSLTVPASLAPGIYEWDVTVMDSQGCSGVGRVILTVEDCGTGCENTTISVSAGTINPCGGSQEININASGGSVSIYTGPVSVIPDCDTSNVVFAPVSGNTFVVTENKTYYFKVDDGNGCCEIASIVISGIASSTNIVVADGVGDDCGGLTIPSISGGTPTYKVEFLRPSGAAAFTATGVSGTSPLTLTCAQLNGGTIDKIRVTDANGCTRIVNVSPDFKCCTSPIDLDLTSQMFFQIADNTIRIMESVKVTLCDGTTYEWGGTGSNCSSGDNFYIWIGGGTTCNNFLNGRPVPSPNGGQSFSSMIDEINQCIGAASCGNLVVSGSLNIANNTGSFIVSGNECNCLKRADIKFTDYKWDGSCGISDLTYTISGVTGGGPLNEPCCD